MQSILRRTLAPSHSLLRCQVNVTPRAFRTFGLRTIVTKKYTVEHECVAFDDSTGLGVISITDHAQSSLGDVVFVELPQVGTVVAQHDQIGAVESYAPVSGEVEEINETLADQPGLLNKSPEEKGWLCKIKLSDPSELEKLMNKEEYEASYEH
ncbi:single hybrid motif-containing protein [Lentinula lateritia]|nr:single hybrid motif-containing protein [Lentinula lateritia]